MKKIVALGTIIAGMLATSQALAGPTSLQGATITASYNSLANGILSWTNSFDLSAPLSSAQIDGTAQVEFLTSDFLFGFDFDASGLITIYKNMPVDAGPYQVNFSFSGLSETISSITLADTSTLGGSSGVGFGLGPDGHSVSINLSSVNWGAADYNSFTAQLGFTSAVPEPAMPAMLIAGLGVLGLARRKLV